MAFTGHNIFPGLQAVGAIPEQLRAGLVVYTASALEALNGPTDDQVAWADDAGVANVTTGDFTAALPIDITSLEGFQEDTGKDYEYHKVDLIAVTCAAVPFYLACSWKSDLTNLPMVNAANKGTQVIRESQALKAQMIATVAMQGRPGGKALTYPQEGSPLGLSLWNTAHLINPNNASAGTFSNYMTGVGKFDSAFLKKLRTKFRMVRGPSSTTRTLGLRLTEILIPSHMEEVVNDVAIAGLVLQVAQVGGAAVAGAVSNTAGTASPGTPWTFRVVTELDNDPYLVAFRAAFLIANGRQPEPEELPHFGIAIAGNRKGANLVEMIAPSTAFVPRISVLGMGSEHEIKTSEIAIIAKQKCGAAAALPYVGIRFEETA
jgi:hypothetical protein